MWGIEGDVDGAQIRATQTGFLAPTAAFVGGSAFLNEKQNWLASIRGRIGYTWGPGLIYITGGAAWTSIQADGGATLFSGETNTFTLSTTRGGYVLGAGYEWMFAPNWSVRGEYLYYGFQGNLNGPVILFPGVLPLTVASTSLTLRSFASGSTTRWTGFGDHLGARSQTRGTPAFIRGFFFIDRQARREIFDHFDTYDGVMTPTTCTSSTSLIAQ